MKNLIIVITGIFLRKRVIGSINKLVDDSDTTVEIYNPLWLDNSISFDKIYREILDIVKTKYHQGYNIKLVGLSAGGLLGILIFPEVQQYISNLTVVSSPIKENILIKIGKLFSNKFKIAFEKINVNNYPNEKIDSFIMKNDFLVSRSISIPNSTILPFNGHLYGIKKYLSKYLLNELKSLKPLD